MAEDVKTIKVPYEERHGLRTEKLDGVIYSFPVGNGCLAINGYVDTNRVYNETLIEKGDGSTQSSFESGDTKLVREIVSRVIVDQTQARALVKGLQDYLEWAQRNNQDGTNQS